MNQSSHYRDYETVSRSILGFTHYARGHDLNVGLDESQAALQTAALGLMVNKVQFKFALKSIFCCSEEDGHLFDTLYDEYWNKKIDISNRIRHQKEVTFPASKTSSLVFMGEGETDENGDLEAKEVSGASRIQRLRNTDFAKVAEVDAQYLEEIVLSLVKQMSLRLKKQLARSHKGTVNIRSTIRMNMGNGGNLIELVRQHKKKKRYRLVILLDASGSMDKYSFYLLRFIWALKSRFKSVETFVFSTVLVKITPYLRDRELVSALQKLSAKVHNWSSGTKIGECLETFNQVHAKRVLNGRSIVIVLSDGLDTGDPEILAHNLAMIKKRTKKLIWLNPLKGMEGYAPLARGMRAALPEIDMFQSAHNLNSLLDLEKFLADVY